VTDPATLDAALAGVDAVVGAAQFSGFPIEQPSRGLTFDNVDRRGTENLLAAAGRVGVRRYLYLSGAGADPRSRYPWFRAKGHAEAAIRSSGILYTIFRPSWVYGPGDKSLNRFVTFARRLPFVPVIGSGEEHLWPAFIGDLAEVVAGAVYLPAAERREFEVGGPELLTMNQILRTMLDVMGLRRPLVHAPVVFPRLASAVMERVLPHPPLTPGAIDFVLSAGGDVDTTALRETFPIRFRPLREGLATYLAPHPSRERTSGSGAVPRAS
jgi:NADH dehydrogenase